LSERSIDKWIWVFGQFVSIAEIYFLISKTFEYIQFAAYSAFFILP